MTRPTVPAIALLPIRLFFGATFLYAGLDKLLDPTFFDPSAPTSIHAQLVAFARLSPLGEVIRASLPLAEPIGLVIAVAEIAIGIGALSGLAFRVAAAGGALLSGLFFLTASWATHPFYFGPDLPYAAGWITLAIAGHGDLLVPQVVRDAFATMAVAQGARPPALAPGRRTKVGYGPGGRRRPGSDRNAGPDRRTGLDGRLNLAARAGGRGVETVPTSPERRLLLQTGLLAGLAAIAASFALPFRATGSLTEPGPSPTGPTPTPGPSSGAVGSPAPGGSSGPGDGTVVATVADVQQGGGGAAFIVPFNAPAPLPAGDPGIVVQLADGSFVAFDAVCTHEGCTVGWDAQDGVILCPCHEAAFDPANAAAVIQGPARRPLAAIPIVVDQATGTISLGS